MSDPVILVLVSLALAIIATLYAVVMWNARQSARYLMRAVGVVLVVVGAYVTGVSALLLDGVRAFIDWLYTEQLDTAMWVGIGVGVVGLVAFLIGGLIKAPTRAEAKQIRVEREAKRRAAVVRQVQRNPAQTAATPPPLPRPSATPAAPAPSAASNPDDEVANILKKHGIE